MAILHKSLNSTVPKIPIHEKRYLINYRRRDFQKWEILEKGYILNHHLEIAALAELPERTCKKGPKILRIVCFFREHELTSRAD